MEDFRMIHIARERERLMRRLDTLADEEVRIQKMNELRAQFGEDVYEVGAILRFDKTYDTGTYSYVAIKNTDGLWYHSGPMRGDTPLSWAQLTAWLTSGVPTSELWIITEMERVL